MCVSLGSLRDTYLAFMLCACYTTRAMPYPKRTRGVHMRKVVARVGAYASAYIYRSICSPLDLSKRTISSIVVASPKPDTKFVCYDVQTSVTPQYSIS